MTLTPNRDAVAAAAAEARRLNAADLAVEDAAGIGLRMAIEAAEAVLGGVADMTDREIPLDQVWPQVGRSVAHVLTAFLMTTFRGDADQAAAFLPGALASVHELAAERLAQGRAVFAEGVTPFQHPPGRA